MNWIDGHREFVKKQRSFVKVQTVNTLSWEDIQKRAAFLEAQGCPELKAGVELEITLLKCDGHDEAILGVVSGMGMPDKLCYDTNKIIDKLVYQDGMTHEEAYEFFGLKIAGTYVGEGTPCFLRELDKR